MKYVRLRLEDQYEAQYYTPAGKEIQFEEGQEIRVRWPNGTESTEKVYLETHTEIDFEHGHPWCLVENTLPYIRSSANGVKVMIDDFSKLEIAVNDIKLAKNEKVICKPFRKTF